MKKSFILIAFVVICMILVIIGLMRVHDSYDDVEVDDEANSVFKKYDNPFAKKRETASDKLSKSHLLDDFMTN